MNDFEAFLMDVFGNIVGNKLTDIDKERMLRFGVNVLIDIKQQLDRIEHKIDKLNKEKYDAD